MLRPGSLSFQDDAIENLQFAIQERCSLQDTGLEGIAGLQDWKVYILGIAVVRCYVRAVEEGGRRIIISTNMNIMENVNFDGGHIRRADGKGVVLTGSKLMCTCNSLQHDAKPCYNNSEYVQNGPGAQDHL